MQRLCLVFLCASALTVICAHADEFSWQLAGGARNSDVGNSAETDGATLTATYYFRPVDDTMGPYALAAFLDRTSRIGASYNEDKTTALAPIFRIGPIMGPLPAPGPATATVVDRGAGRSLSGRHVWRTSGWYVGAALAEADAAHPAPLPTSFSVLADDVSSGSLLLGKYVGASTAVELSFEATEATLTSELPLFCLRGLCSIAPIARLTMTLETDSRNIGISAQHVGRLGKLAYSLSGGVTSNDVDATLDFDEIPIAMPVPLPVFPAPPPAGGFVSVRPSATSAGRRERYAVTGELFPTQALGLRAGYARWDADASLDESYELGATWFFRRNIGARVTISRTKTDLPVRTADDVESVTLQLIGRL